MFDLLMICSSSISLHFFFFLFPCFLLSFKPSLSAPCYLSASSISIHRRVLHPEVSAFFTMIPLPEILRRRLMFSPSPACCRILWLRLTSDRQALYRYRLLLLRASLLPQSTVYQISPGKNANFLSIYLSDLHPHVSDSFGLCFVMQTHPHESA